MKMKTNLYNKVYVCKECRRPGGTLKNTGTHREPRYICAACRKKCEQLAALRLAAAGKAGRP